MLSFEILRQAFKQQNHNAIYLIDTFPIPVCDNIRITRAKVYQGESFRGYTHSKRRHFYGVKVHLMITLAGQFVELFFIPGSVSDVKGFQTLSFDLPKDSVIYADKAYNDYGIENLLANACQIHLMPLRKKNPKRTEPAYV